MTQKVATTPEAPELPIHLRQGKKASLGNIDTTDLIVPRVKLLASVSPEVEEFEAAKPGEFWHSIAACSLGKSLRMIPLVIRKSYVLWAPRGDSRGVLARANDAIHWDNVDEFRVKVKNVAKDQIWKTAATVAESGLDKFGSSVAGDPNSSPAASLTYNILVYLPDYPELSPAVVLNTRSSVKKARLLISKIEMRPYDHYDQVFQMSSIQEEKNGETFYNFNYVGDGYTSAEEHDITERLFRRFTAADFKASDEREDEEAGPSNIGGTNVPF